MRKLRTKKEKGKAKKEKEEKVIAVCRLLSKHYGKPRAIVNRGTPFQTVVATALSARTKDVNTAKACKALFAKYPTARKLAVAKQRDVEKLIKPVGMYKTKAKNIIALAKQTQNGVPKTIDELVTLPGVGRKTANCTLIYAFGIPAMCVDTHVHRISNLLGWVNTKTPEKTEWALRALVPKRYWLGINDWLVKHGQTICPARYPKCHDCFLNQICDYGRKALKQ